MNPRERNLLIVLAVILACGVGVYGIKRFFWDPLQTYNAEIDAMEKANAELSEKLDTFNRERKKLTLARLKSLPADTNQASAEYMTYVRQVFESNGLSVEKVTPAAAVKVKPSTPIPNVKEVGHLMMPFTVHARGELSNLVLAMEHMLKTPYEHRIRSVVVDRNMRTGSDTTKLTIVMNIETLIVAKSKNQPGLLPGVDPAAVILDVMASRGGLMPIPWGMVSTSALHGTTMPTPAGRDYAKIGDKNIFVGPQPPPKQEIITKYKVKDTPSITFNDTPLKEEATSLTISGKNFTSPSSSNQVTLLLDGKEPIDFSITKGSSSSLTLSLSGPRPDPGKLVARVENANGKSGLVQVASVVDIRPSPPPEFTPRYVFLTSTFPEQHTIFLRNKLYEPADPSLREQRIESQSKFDKFQIGDEDNNYIFFKAKLLKVELRYAYFQVQDNIYKIRPGQDLADAMGYQRGFKGQKGQNLLDDKTGKSVTQPLNNYWLNIEVAGLYDPRWSAVQVGGKDKTESKSKKFGFR